MQMAVVLEYMDGGTLADVLKKVIVLVCSETLVLRPAHPVCGAYKYLLRPFWVRTLPDLPFRSHTNG
jgi:hypothetical protein